MDSVFTLGDLIDRQAVVHAERPAVRARDQTVSFAELPHRVGATAAVLTAHGVGKGDRVAIYHHNSLETLEWFLGTVRLGAVAVIVHEGLTAPQVEYIVRHSGARILITGSRGRGRLSGQAPGQAVTVDVAERGGSHDVGVVDAPIGSDLAALIYTSGSTGLPKGVMVTHSNLLAGARIVARYLGLTEADRTLSVLPWSFDAGLNQVLATFVAGGTLVVSGSRYAPDLCRALQQHRITGMAGVPPLWEIMVNRPSPFTELRLPDLRYVTNTGGVLQAATLAAIRRAHPGVQVVLMYGLTEAFRSTYLPPDLVDRYPGSMGKPIPDTEILVLNAEGGRCGPGEVGELVHRGPTVAAGYWRDPTATAAVFRPHPFPVAGAVPEHVVYSGDYVRWDDNGLLHFVGRRDEQFKSRGFRVSPTEVEVGLLASPLLREAVVFAEAGGQGEPDIVAAVVPADPASFDETELLRHCRDTMPAHHQPTRVTALPALPRTSSGKIDRARAKQQARAAAVGGEAGHVG